MGVRGGHLRQAMQDKGLVCRITVYQAGKQKRTPWDGLGVQRPGNMVCSWEPRTHRAAAARGIVVSSDSHLGQMRALRDVG